MLQRQAFQENLPNEDSGQFLTPSHILDIGKRRWLHFTVPFLLFAGIGAAIAMLLPAQYLAQGKILVESPQIPSDLVQPTVAVLANERIQIIQQRIMTRDNLLALAKKFGLTTNWQGRVSGTDLVDFIKSRTDIAAFDATLANAPKARRNTNAIAFTIGFTYERPEVAVKVANEFMTMILNEDVRGRTNSATEATRFLAQEVKRLEGQIGLIDTQINTLTKAAKDAGTDTGAKTSDDVMLLTKLKTELLVKGATLSDEHPDIKALKRRIESFEKKIAGVANAKADVGPRTATNESETSGATKNVPQAAVPAAAQVNIDALTTQKVNLNAELASTTKKLAIARLGENLERGQFAERLQVIEQPSMPDKPVQPNRPKIFAFALAFAVMASGGIVVAAEVLNPAIRRSADLFSIIDSHLIVSIPYVTTLGEVRRRKKKIIFATGFFLTFVTAGVCVALFILPPIDVLMAKLFPGL